MPRLVYRVVRGEPPQGFQQISAGRQFPQLLCELLAVPLRDAGDKLFLGGKIKVKRSGAYTGLLADVLHGRAMKARPGEAALRRIEDLLPPMGLGLGFQSWHVGRPGERQSCSLLAKRTLVLVWRPLHPARWHFQGRSSGCRAVSRIPTDHEIGTR